MVCGDACARDRRNRRYAVPLEVPCSVCGLTVQVAAGKPAKTAVRCQICRDQETLERSWARGRRFREKNRERLREYARQQTLRQSGDPHRAAIKRARSRQYLYGLTEDQYTAMNSAQNGLCMICGQRPAGQGGKTDDLVVDHCHVTDVVRDLLCWKCNIALGMFGEDVSTLESAIAYIRRWEGITARS